MKIKTLVLLAGLLALLQTLPASARALDLPDNLHGFWEARGGVRLQTDDNERQVSMGESRLQLDYAKMFDAGTFRVRGDFLYDDVDRTRSVNLNTGEGWIDLREANLLLYPADFMDLKIGRQILTWGTGDLLFLNDLFPKDWRSFLMGRDEEYLKAPSDAVKASFFSDLVNLDVVYMPRFNPDRYITGSRLSYWNDQLGEIAGRNAIVQAEVPNGWFDDDELALRLYKNLRGTEMALYAYSGYWKSPAGQDPATAKATFPALAVYGASVRRAVWKGIGNLEVAYYDSKDDRSGTDPLVRNSEMRFLAGYEQELFRDFTLGLQYYLEYMKNYSDYLDTLPAGFPKKDRERHVTTARLTWLLMNQNLTLSLFVFYSPSDHDAYLRPNVHYKLSDAWAAEVGANLFARDEDYTFYGQFNQDANVYTAIRYSF